MRRRRALPSAVTAVTALVLGLLTAPAHAQTTGSGAPRDVLVVDVVSSTSSSTAHHRFDSSIGPAPVVTASEVVGGLRVARPAGTSTGPSVEVLPADGAPLAVGTYTGVRGRWTTGTVRPVPVVRLVSGIGACAAFQSTPASSRLLVHDVEHDAAGAVVRLSASWEIPCSDTGSSATGEIRFRSTAHHASASSFSKTLGTVVSGSRTPFTATVVNTGSEPLSLGVPVPVDRGPSAPRLELAAGGEDCSAVPVPVGGRCTLALEYVDDGEPGGGYLAELRLAAPAVLRGSVSVLATVWEVVHTPGAASSLRGTSAYDGVALAWSPADSGRLPDDWRIRRVDGGTPVEVAALPGHVRTWVDTSLAKGESATYEVAGHNAAGEGPAVRVTVARQDRPDPPPAVDRRTLVMDGLAGIGVADTAAGAPVQVTDIFTGTTVVTGAGMVLHLPRLPGAGTFPVGSAPGSLPVLAYGPPATCGSTTGAAEVREAWVRADGTVHRLDADLHLECAGARIEVGLRLGTGGPFVAVTTDDDEVTDLHGTVGQAPTTRDVTFRNAGTVPVELGATSVTGADAPAFGVQDGTCSTVLEPGGSCRAALRFAPTRSGEHRARLSLGVSTALGTRSVGLVGTSSGPPQVRVPVVQPVLGRTLLRWHAGADGGAPVTAVRVQRASGDEDFTTVADLPPDALSWVDTEAVPGQAHRYRLLTENRYGSSLPDGSDVVEVVGASEELLAAVATSSTAAADLASLGVAEGHPVPLGTGQDVDLPTVSPDGRTVAHVALDADGDAGLWSRPLSGDDPPRLLVDEPGVDETDPAWSPDGATVCYSRLTDDDAAVWCVGTADGARPRAHPAGTDAAEPSFLPDGSALVVTDLSSERTALARLSPQGARTVLPGTEDGRWPAVSPTGERVAFVVTDDQGTDHLRTVPVAGGRAVQLASTSDLYERPSWSPDGRALAVPTLGLWSAATVTVWRDADGGTPATVEEVRVAAGADVLAVAWRRLDRAAPTITFPGAPTRTGRAVRLPVRVLDDTAPVGGLSVRCAVDGTDVGRCAEGWSGTLAAGVHRLAVTAVDAHGRSASATHTFVVDTAPPAVALGGLPAFALTSAVAVSYTASDPSGVAAYDVRYRRASFSDVTFSGWAVPAGWASTTARSRTMSLAPGYEYCVSVRARDRVGNTSAWSSERCTARPLDDRALGRATGAWRSTTNPTAYAGTLTSTVVRSAALVRASVRTRRIAVVATTCPTCGSVDVLVGTTRVGTLSLVSSATRPRQVLAVPLQPTVRSGTLRIRTRSGRPVHVDGLGLRRT